MCKKNKRHEEEKLVHTAEGELDLAADKAVKEARKTQEVIIANGFTLELLLAFSGKGKHD